MPWAQGLIGAKVGGGMLPGKNDVADFPEWVDRLYIYINMYLENTVYHF